jgi:hypothetical protein
LRRNNVIFSADGGTLLIAHNDGSWNRLYICAASTGELLKSLTAPTDGRAYRLDKLVLGNRQLVGMVGTNVERSRNIDTLWVFQLDLAPTISIMRRFTGKVHLGADTASYNTAYRPYHIIKFSANDETLLVGTESIYEVLNATTGASIGRFSGLRPNHAIAISPDNKRVLSIDSDGLILRDCASSQELPRLKTLPWGGWQSRLEGKTPDTFAINANWSRCVATARSIDVNSKTSSRSLHLWYTDAEVLPDDKL